MVCVAPVVAIVSVVCVSWTIAPRVNNDAIPVAAAAAVIAVTAFAFLPVTWLPASMIILYAAIPGQLLIRFNTVPILGFILIIWAVRKIFVVSRESGLRLFRPLGGRFWVLATTGLFLTWISLGATWSVNPPLSILFVVAFAVTVVIYLLVPDITVEAALVAKSWIVAGAIASIYASLEFVAGKNVIADALREFSGRPLHQWSVYRSEAWFVHPLYASVYLAIAAMLGVGVWIVRGNLLSLACGLICVFGVVTTGSRGGLVAVAVGLAVTWLVAAFRVRPLPSARMILAAVIGIIGVYGVQQLPSIAERAASLEAQRSSEARDIGFQQALHAAEHYGWLGSGGFTSKSVFDAVSDIPLENAYLQLLVSIGVPGVALFALLMLSLLLLAVTRRAAAEAGALATCIVVLGTFNAIDDVPGHLLLLGACVLLIVGVPTARTPHDSKVQGMQLPSEGGLPSRHI